MQADMIGMGIGQPMVAKLPKEFVLHLDLDRTSVADDPPFTYDN